MVDFDFETEEIVEGKASILVPKTLRGKGPGKKEGIPFYNPVMEINRDISVLVLQKRLSKGKEKVLDGLAGTGIRGIRFALEVEGDFSVLLNDWNKPSYQLMRKNIERNKVHNAEAGQEDFNTLLTREDFDYVDVDPYGTPVPFLDSALKGVKERGTVAITATDIAALAGRFPNACMKKYGAVPLQTKTRHETGLRILIGYCARTAEKYEMGVRPLMSHSTDHYYRTYLEMERGQGAAASCAKNVGYLSINPSTREILMERERRGGFKVAGPLWIANLWDPVLLKKMRLRSYMSPGTSRVLELMKSECDIELPFYSSDEIASSLKVHTPALAEIIESLKETGFSASPTHIDPKGFRTNAPIERILELFRGN